MSINNILLIMEFRFLQDFLKHSCRWDDVEKNEDGDLDEADFDKLLYRQNVAARAAYYELNALVESEIYAAASGPWQASNHKGPKTLSECLSSGKDLKFMKMVEDLSIKDAISLIEKEYKVKLLDFPGYVEVFKVRETVNDFKHRKGFVDFRKQSPDQIKFADRRKVDVDTANFAISCAKDFIYALRKITGTYS